MKRRSQKCYECPYKDKKPSERSKDELAYARCTEPEHFPCHVEELIYDEHDLMCRGHWEMYQAAVKKGIQPDESAGDRIFPHQ